MMSCVCRKESTICHSAEASNPGGWPFKTSSLDSGLRPAGRPRNDNEGHNKRRIGLKRPKQAPWSCHKHGQESRISGCRPSKPKGMASSLRLCSIAFFSYKSARHNLMGAALPSTKTTFWVARGRGGQNFQFGPPLPRRIFNCDETPDSSRQNFQFWRIEPGAGYI
jgi:hypothetical protein